jgi:hypothetical protein
MSSDDKLVEQPSSDCQTITWMRLLLRFLKYSVTSRYLYPTQRRSVGTMFLTRLSVRHKEMWSTYSYSDPYGSILCLQFETKFNFCDKLKFYTNHKLFSLLCLFVTQFFSYPAADSIWIERHTKRNSNRNREIIFANILKYTTNCNVRFSDFE